MEKRKNRSFSAEFKAGAVKLVLESGKSAAQVARDLDVVPSVLGGWVKHAKTEKEPHGAGALKAAERDELTRLRKEERVWEMERAFLKKAAAFFARESA